MMRLFIVSDLHLEFFPDHLRDGFLEQLGKIKADALVVAGDLTTFQTLGESLRKVCSLFPHVLFVPGNHEYYGTSFDTVRSILAKSSEGCKNLHVLDRGVVTIDGHRFIGATLWFKDEPMNSLYRYNVSDFRVIKDFTKHVYEENRKDVAFLEKTVQKGDIVITHHLPCPKSIHENFHGSNLNDFFMCDVPHLFQLKPKLWIHGHTHHSFDYTTYRTRVYCNPSGYYRIDPNPEFSYLPIAV